MQPNLQKTCVIACARQQLSHDNQERNNLHGKRKSDRLGPGRNERIDTRYGEEQMGITAVWGPAFED